MRSARDDEGRVDTRAAIRRRLHGVDSERRRVAIRNGDPSDFLPVVKGCRGDRGIGDRIAIVEEQVLVGARSEARDPRGLPST